MWLALTLLVPAFGADCPTPTTREELTEALTHADVAYENADLPGFELAIERARVIVPCLDGVAPPSLAASVHRHEGLAAFVSSQTERAELAFAAARRLDPLYRFPTSMVPADNPVNTTYLLRDPATFATETVASPGVGSYRFDGQPTRTWRPELPTLFQHVDVSGAALRTQYVWPSDPLPIDAAVVRRHRLRTPLLLGAAGALAASAATYGAAYALHEGYANANDPPKTRATNHALVISSAGLLAVSIGTGTAAFVVK